VIRQLLVFVVVLGLGAVRAGADDPDRVFQRIDVRFDCGETSCAAWLYQPVGLTRPPVVVMAHGFGATRGMFLPRFAERFAARGIAVFVFDYRYLGESGGEPRQLIDPTLQIQDWHSAIAHLRSRSDVDTTRLGLWGTSFSGGHVIVVAAEDPQVKAVVSQVPFVGMDAVSERPPLLHTLALLSAASWDSLRAALGLTPHYVPLTGPAGSGALMTDRGSDEVLGKADPEGVTSFRNEVAARVLWSLNSYRPGLRAEDLSCPLLLIPARADALVPLASVEAVAVRAPDARLAIVEGEHYDVYVDGPTFNQVVELESDFFLQHLSAH